MLVKSGDLIPVRPEAAAIPWTKRKSQVLNHLHRGDVTFETLVYDTNVGDISTLAAYFNPSRWSEFDLNNKFGIQPQNSGPTDVSRDALLLGQGKAACKTHSICPRLLIYPEKAKDENKLSLELQRSLPNFLSDKPSKGRYNHTPASRNLSKGSNASSGYSSAGTSRSTSPVGDFGPPSNTWGPAGATTELLSKAWGPLQQQANQVQAQTKQQSMINVPPHPPPAIKIDDGASNSGGAAGPRYPPGLSYLQDGGDDGMIWDHSNLLSPSKNALALDLSSAIFQDVLSSSASTTRRPLFGRAQPCFSSSDIDFEGLQRSPISKEVKASPQHKSMDNFALYDSVFSSNATETLV